MSSAYNFAGKTAFVSGGASGIGRANVRKFAAGGATVAFTDINEEGGRAVEAEIKAGGGDARFFKVDSTNPDEVNAVMEKAFAINKRLDCAVNNVGGGGGAHFLAECDRADWDKALLMSVTTTYMAMHAQIPLMLKTGGGAIVNISSMAAVKWSATAGVSYSVAKAAVIRLTEFTAVSYAPQNIRVNVVCPGVTATEAVVKFIPEPEKRAALAASQHAVARMMEPEEIADACVWACSDASSGVTGLMIPVAGGGQAR